MWKLKNGKNELIYKIEIESQMGKQTYGYQGEKELGRDKLRDWNRHIHTAAAAKSLQSCPTLCDPVDGAHQAPSLGFSRQEHWSGLPFPSPVHESEK